MKENGTLSSPSYSQVVRSASFQSLLAAKRKFILPMTIFFLVFYFALPVMTSYFRVLNEPAVGPISWAWVFAFAQFIMTWTLCILYSRKAKSFDALAARIQSEMKGDFRA